MNAQRRAMIKRLIKQVEALQASIDTGPIDALKDSIEEVREAEQEAFDNLPESLQEGEKGEKMNEAIEKLDAVQEVIQDLLNTLEEFDADELVSQLNDACA